MTCEKGALDVAMPRITKVLHVIPWLKQGGAEAMLANLVRYGDGRVQHHVHTLMPADNFFGLDPARVTSGTGARGRPSLRMALELNASIARQRPDIVHGWMYHANFMTILVRRGHKVVWSIHNAGLTNEKRTTRLVSAICAKASSRIPDRIVYVSQTVREAHEAAGYDPRRGQVIANGVDLDRFSLKPERPLSPDAPVRIALVGRYDPVKGHRFLIDVVARHPARSRIKLIFAGLGCDTSLDLRAAIENAGLADRCEVSGPIQSIETVYAAADVVVLPSFAEASPVTIFEAAASGAVICASRVGELVSIGLDQRFLFAPGDAAGCAASLSAAITERTAPTGVGARNRAIAERHGLGATVQNYEALYAELVGSGAI
ncbi:MAG: glycosyltransferase [Hyphomicrobiaceae bacterium]